MPKKLKFKTLAQSQMALDLKEEQSRKRPAEIPLCEIEYCFNEGRFGYSPPGFAGLRQPARYFCHAHKPE